MSQCTPRYLSLCSVPQRMSRDGLAGANAHINLPNYGLLFFSGAVFTPVGAQIPQDDSMFVAGVHKVDTYKKEGFWCDSGV